MAVIVASESTTVWISSRSSQRFLVTTVSLIGWIGEVTESSFAMRAITAVTNPRPILREGRIGDIIVTSSAVVTARFGTESVTRIDRSVAAT